MVQNSAPPKSEGHYDFIDGIRALAALFVVICHAYYEPSAGFFPDAPWLYKLGLTYGRVAVTTFIVVSGFCLMLPIARRGDDMGSFLSYMQRRCRRILPPYFAALTIAILFSLTFASQKTGTVWDLCMPVTWGVALQQYFLVHNFPWIMKGAAEPVNYPLWSIAVEFQIYFFMPLILGSLKRWGNVPTIIAVLLFGATIYYVLPPEWRKTNLWFVILFTLGAVAARECVRRKDAFPVAIRWLTFALWFLSAALIPIVGSKLKNEFAPFYDILIGVAAALLLAVSMVDTERKYTLTRLLSWRPLVLVGLFSYSLYLIHAPILHGIFLLVHSFAKPSAPAMFAILLICVPVIIGGAYLFYWVFERPFLSAGAKARKVESMPAKAVEKLPA